MRLTAFDREFAGLFMGEGCIDVSRQGRSAHHIRPRVRIGMHARDLALLRAVQGRYGGSLTVRQTDGSITWQLTGAERLSVVCAILERSLLASCKDAEVRLLREAITLRRDPTRMAEIQRELSALKGH